MTREEHMEWCKKRAMEYIEKGDYLQGLTSMFSDLGKHTETQSHVGIKLGMGLMMMGALSSYRDSKRFIEGFN